MGRRMSELKSQRVNCHKRFCHITHTLHATLPTAIRRSQPHAKTNKNNSTQNNITIMASRLLNTPNDRQNNVVGHFVKFLGFLRFAMAAPRVLHRAERASESESTLSVLPLFHNYFHKLFLRDHTITVVDFVVAVVVVGNQVNALRKFLTRQRKRRAIALATATKRQQRRWSLANKDGKLARPAVASWSTRWIYSPHCVVLLPWTAFCTLLYVLD